MTLGECVARTSSATGTPFSFPKPPGVSADGIRATLVDREIGAIGSCVGCQFGASKRSARGYRCKCAIAGGVNVGGGQQRPPTLNGAGPRSQRQELLQEVDPEGAAQSQERASSRISFRRRRSALGLCRNLVPRTGWGPSAPSSSGGTRRQWHRVSANSDDLAPTTKIAPLGRSSPRSLAQPSSRREGCRWMSAKHTFPNGACPPARVVHMSCVCLLFRCSPKHVSCVMLASRA